MTFSATHRLRGHELMDQPGVDPALLQRNLRFIRRVNGLLGYRRATLWHLRRFSRGWTPGQRIDMVDLATGSADIPRAILRWARRRGFDVRIVGVDRHAVTIGEAAAAAFEPRLGLVRADVLAAPFAPRSFDYALTGMFLHHLDDEQVVQTLAAMNALARRGIIAADLLRTRGAYRGIRLLTLLANPMARYDARLSVAQAFTEQEITALRDQAGAAYARYWRHRGYRFVLAGEK